jgi:hypothetical protein
MGGRHDSSAALRHDENRERAMRAHRVKVQISEDHELRVKLPSDFPPGEAEVIVLESRDEAEETTRALTVDELLAAGIKPPPGVEPVSLEDMERAIDQGASGRSGV